MFYIELVVAVEVTNIPVIGMLNLTHGLRLRYCYLMKQRWIEYLELNIAIKARFSLSCNSGFK